MIAVAATVVVVGGVFAWREYARTHPGTATRAPAFTVSAERLLADFQADEEQATAKYVGSTEQVLLVTGTVRSIEADGRDRVNVVLATSDDLAGVVCEFPEGGVPAEWRAGMEVSVKGVCTGMLLDVVLTRCAALD